MRSRTGYNDSVSSAREDPARVRGQGQGREPERGRGPGRGLSVERCKGTFFHDLLGAWAIAWTYLPMLAALALFARWPALWSFALAFVMISVRQNALFVVAHESWHLTLFRSRRASELAGAWLASYPLLMPNGPTREGHLEHHRRVGTLEDPDRYAWNWGLEERAAWARHLLAVASGVPFLVRAGRALLGLPAPAGESARRMRPSHNLAGDRRELLGLGVVQLTLLGLFAVTIGWYWYFALWLLPAISLHLVVDEMRQFLEHRNGRILVYEASPLGRFILGAFNFHLHAVHHVFASEPWFCLPALKERALGKRSDIVRLKGYFGELVAYLRGRDRVGLSPPESAPDAKGFASASSDPTAQSLHSPQA